MIIVVRLLIGLSDLGVGAAIGPPSKRIVLWMCSIITLLVTENWDSSHIVML